MGAIRAIYTECYSCNFTLCDFAKLPSLPSLYKYVHTVQQVSSLAFSLLEVSNPLPSSRNSLSHCCYSYLSGSLSFLCYQRRTTKCTKTASSSFAAATVISQRCHKNELMRGISPRLSLSLSEWNARPILFSFSPSFQCRRQREAGLSLCPGEAMLQNSDQAQNFSSGPEEFARMEGFLLRRRRRDASTAHTP